MFEADNVSLMLGGHRLLDGVSAQFAAGKISIILGPNGAGKSTLLACLVGLRAPDSGGAMLDGAAVSGMDITARARRIGLLPQNADVHWDIRAGDLVALGRYPHHRQSSEADDSAAIKAAMEATDTLQYAARNVLSLSGGERARVLLARVLAGEPEWLLADEPLANLDPRYQLQLLAQLRALAGKGAGVIAVLHDLTQAARVADFVVLLNEGRVFAAGSPESVLTAENLREVYDITSAVFHDDDGKIAIIPGGYQAARKVPVP